MTAGIEWRANSINSTIPKVDDFFEKILGDRGKKSTDLDVAPVDKGPPDAQARQISMGFYWSKYHLIHSGGAEAFRTSEIPSSKQWFDVLRIY